MHVQEEICFNSESLYIVYLHIVYRESITLTVTFKGTLQSNTS